MTAIVDFNAASAARKVDVARGSSNDTVSRQWISRPADERFLDLNSLHASVAARRDNSRQDVVLSNKIEVLAPAPKTLADTHKLSFGLPNGEEVYANNWSFSQLCQRAKAPAGYLRTLPSQITADALTHDLRKNNNGWIKTYANGETLLAATGPDYGRIYDAEVIEAVQQIAGNGTGDFRWKVPGVLDWRTHVYDPHAPVTLDTTTLFASDRDVFVFLCDDLNPIEVGKLPDGSPDLVSRGFFVSNSEVGSSTLRLAAFYFRAICCNRILWGVENFQELTIRHTKAGPARFIEECRPALESFANGSTQKLLDGVKAAKEAKIANDQDEAIKFLQERSFSRKKALEILEQGEEEEGRPVRSVWDVAQALTANARNEKNNDTRLEIELVAKKILDKVV